MIVAELTERALARRLSGPGLRLRTGPVVNCVRSALPEVAAGIALQYADHPVDVEDGFADFHVAISRPRNVRRWLKPQVVFQFDGAPPFNPLPGGQGFPILEWGLNWCVSAHYHRYLVLHSAVLERTGRALLLQGPPGAGKSTLCAGLVSRGWRLLSDELALVDPATGQVHPLARPISLKNASIEVIGRFSPQAVLGPTVHDTLKGSVAHMKPPAQSVRRSLEPAPPRWVVFPRHEPGAPATFAPLPRGCAFMRLAEGAFNYELHGRAGFETLAALIEACQCHDFRYGDLAEATRLFAELAGAP